MRLLLTRPDPQARAFAAVLDAAAPGRFDPWVQPFLTIVVEPARLDLAGLQGLLFTSANGVAAFAARSDRRDLPALCVGPGTADAARATGFSAESAEGDVGALARLAHDAWLEGAGDYLHVRGRETAGDLSGALAAEGIAVREVILYEARPLAAIPAPLDAALRAGAIDVVALFSPRTARLFAAFAAEGSARGAPWALGTAAAVTIGPGAADAVAGCGFGLTRVAATPDAAGMIAALCALPPGLGREPLPGPPALR